MADHEPLTGAELESIAHTGVRLGGAAIRADRVVAEVLRLRRLIRAAVADDLVPSDGWCHGCNHSVLSSTEDHETWCTIAALEAEARRP